MFAGELLAALDEGLYVGILSEILLNQRRSLLAGDAELLAETEGRDAIDDAEVDALGIAALVFGDLFHRQVVNLGRRGGMDVETAVEGVEHVLVLGQRGDDTELNLRVVGRQQQVVVVSGHEGTAYLAAALGTDGDILQIGIAGREAPRSGDGLVVDRVQTSRGRINKLRESVEVGTHQLGDGAVLEDERDDGVAVGQFLQHLLGGAVLLGGGARGTVGHLQLLIEHLAQLLGRADIELHPSQVVDLPLDGAALIGKLRGVGAQGLHIDTHALFLHVDKHVDERQLDVGIEVHQGGILQARDHQGIQLPEGGDQCHGALWFEAKQRGADEVERVAHLGVEKVMGQLDIKHRTAEHSPQLIEDIL